MENQQFSFKSEERLKKLILAWFETNKNRRFGFRLTLENAFINWMGSCCPFTSLLCPLLLKVKKETLNHCINAIQYL